MTNQPGSRVGQTNDAQRESASDAPNEIPHSDQYLQVRVAPTPTFRPSRIYRHHHSHQSSEGLSNRRRREIKAFNRRNDTTKGEIVRVLIPNGGFASEKQLSDCLSHACAAEDARYSCSRDCVDAGEDASWDSTQEFYDGGRSDVAVSLVWAYLNDKSFLLIFLYSGHVS
jgi:hypothetical protein